jgi:hypothetical protein
MLRWPWQADADARCCPRPTRQSSAPPRLALLALALLALCAAVTADPATPCIARNNVNGVVTTDDSAAFDNDAKNIHIIGCNNTVVGSDVDITGDSNIAKNNTIGTASTDAVTIIGSSNVVTGNTVETKILLNGANRNTVVNNVAAGKDITFSTDVSDNIVESNGAVRLSHGSREQTD